MHYEELDALLDSLAEAVENEDPQKGYWKELWGLVSQIRGGLRETRYPSGSDKRAAIDRLNALVAAAEGRSKEEKERRAEREQAWEQRRERSGRAKQRVEEVVAGTRPLSDFERGIAAVVLAPLNMLEAILRDAFGMEQLDEVHEDLKSCSAHMREAWSLFGEHKSSLLPGDRNDVYGQLKRAQERLDAAWARWKGAKSQAREDKQRAWQERQRERAEKHARFVERVEANIAKLEAKIEKAEDALARQERHLDNLRDQYREAWNDSFRERCSEWIDEAEDRIRSIEDNLSTWREWLDQERDKIR